MEMHEENLSFDHLTTHCFKSGIKIEGTRIWRNERGGNPDERAPWLTATAVKRIVSRQGGRERD
jgi:hypothetical protein